MKLLLKAGANSNINISNAHFYKEGFELLLNSHANNKNLCTSNIELWGYNKNRKVKLTFRKLL